MNTVNVIHDTNSNRTTISLSKENYKKLSRLGFAGESFNDVIARLIDANKQQKEVRID